MKNVRAIYSIRIIVWEEQPKGASSTLAWKIYFLWPCYDKALSLSFIKNTLIWSYCFLFYLLLIFFCECIFAFLFVWCVNILSFIWSFIIRMGRRILIFFIWCIMVALLASYSGRLVLFYFDWVYFLQEL